MKEVIIKYGFIILFVLGFISCEKKQISPELEFVFPEYTESGTNTAAFEINNKAYNAYDYWADTPGISGYYRNGRFFYFFYNADRYNYYRINLVLDKCKTTGEYEIDNILKPDNYCSAIIEEFKDSVYVNSYATIPGYTGILKINKVDTINKIIAGQFSFTAVEPQSKDTIRVSRAQFDIKYK